MHRHTIQHCRSCGTAVEYRVPDDGDTRERAVCPACGTIHYVNPLLVVGTVPYLGDRVLLVNFHAAPAQVQAGVKTTLGAFAPAGGRQRKAA